jgi:hypothetical protein
MLPLSLVLVLGLSLFFPSFSRAGDSYNDELWVLDLEFEMLSLKSQMLSHERAEIDARLPQATRRPAEVYFRSPRRATFS